MPPSAAPQPRSRRAFPGVLRAALAACLAALPAGLLGGAVLGAVAGVLCPAALAGQREAATAGEGAPTLTVLAAASLADGLPRAAAAWEASGGAPVRLAFDATSRLAVQALRAGGADVLVAADRRWADWLEERGRVDGRPVPVAGNELVVVVPAGASPRPGRLADLSRVGRIALAGETVPAGRYARAALEAAGLSGALAGRIVPGGSVRGALEWVARGEVDAGVVYRTDASGESRVEVAFVVPPELYEPVVYPAVVLADAPHAAEARRFVAFLSGPGGRSALAAAGLGPPPGGPGAEGGARAATSSPPGDVPGPNPWTAVRLSLLVAAAATLLGLVPAVALGRLLARHSFPGKTLVGTLVLVPLVLPPVVTGFLLLMLLGREGPLGAPLAAAGLAVPFTLAAPVIAAVVVGLPLYVVAVRGAFEAIDPRYEEVSLTLGMRPRTTFFRVSLPLALPGIAAGAVLAFARALGEFGATVVLAGNLEGSTRTIALAVYTLLETPGGRGVTWLLVGASVLLSLVALLGYEALSRRQRRRVEDLRGH